MQEIVEKAGGKWEGIQGIPDTTDTLVLFSDPETKTTLAIEPDLLSYDNIALKLIEARANFVKEFKCLGCKGEMNEIKAMNALSRYGHGYICRECGTKEALIGDFISLNETN